MKLVNYQDTYYRALCEFVSRMWPERPSAYLEYRLKKIPEDASDVRVNLLAIDDQDNIVGCTLVFPTRAEIFGEEKKIYWSHDTIIESSCRGEIGMDLMLATNAVEGCFGIGLSYRAKNPEKTPHQFYRRLQGILHLQPLVPHLALIPHRVEEGPENQKVELSQVDKGPWRAIRIDRRHTPIAHTERRLLESSSNGYRPGPR